MTPSRESWIAFTVGLTGVLIVPLVDQRTQLACLFLILCALGYLTLKIEGNRKQLDELDRLKTAHDQLDQQAKLIIQTDIELHRAQEELDRRLASLMSLHQLGQEVRISLTPDEILSKLNPPTVTNFGFSKGLLAISPSPDALEWRSLVGISTATADQLRNHLVVSGLLKQALANPVPRLVQMATAAQAPERRLLELLGVPSVAIAGVIPHAGPSGLLLLGRTGGSVNAKAEEELVGILTNQLAVALENSSLYEGTWKAQQELERKVQQRTHELEQLNAQLVNLNKAKSNFVSAVSHELRTPLAAIKGYASLLNSGQFGELAKPQSERLAKIEKHADLLTELINSLLDIARIESGRITMERHAIPVDEFFATVQEMVRPQLDAKRIRFTMELDGVKELLGDNQHLQRVFMNLLSNAIKYTPDEGQISLALRRDGGDLLASVHDTGCGIPAEELPKLFQEFFRSSDPINQQVKGTGLGLALVRRIVEAHGGKIWVESERNKGTTFSLRLPAG